MLVDNHEINHYSMARCGMWGESLLIISTGRVWSERICSVSRPDKWGRSDFYSKSHLDGRQPCDTVLPWNEASRLSIASPSPLKEVKSDKPKNINDY